MTAQLGRNLRRVDPQRRVAVHRQPHVEDLDAARQEEQRRVLRLRFVGAAACRNTIRRAFRQESRSARRRPRGGSRGRGGRRQRIARRCAERAFVGLAFDREGEHRTVAAIVFGRDAHLLPPACGGGQQRTVLHRREEAVGTTGRLREADHLVARRELHGIIAHGVAVACVAEEEPVHAVLVAYLSVDLFGQAVDAEGIVDFVLAVRALDDEIAAPPDRDGLRLPQRIVPFAAAYHVEGAGRLWTGTSPSESTSTCSRMMRGAIRSRTGSKVSRPAC